MGVYIKGMEMPTDCTECWFRKTTWHEYLSDCQICPFTGETTPYTKRKDDCPLVSVPPHGRLGDLDKLENGLRHMAKYQHGERQQGILGCCETIRLAPTVIPAGKERET